MQKSHFIISQKFAAITGVEERIVRRLYILLCVVNSKRKPNWEKVERYGRETMVLIREVYPWYHPSPSVHTLCLHSRQLMEGRELGPGFYSESSQESYNKRDRHTREFHARKCSRFANTFDIFHNHLAYGDVVFSSKMTRLATPEPQKLHDLEAMYMTESSPEDMQVDDDDDTDDPNYECSSESDAEFD